MHPDFGTVWEGDPIGIPYNVVPDNQPMVNVAFDYSDESDKGPYPIPKNPLIEAGSGAIWHLDRNEERPKGYTSAFCVLCNPSLEIMGTIIS